MDVIFCLYNFGSDGAGGSGKGTCTCTCETKPVSASSSSSAESGIIHPLKPQDQFVPQTASLMRTATKPRQSTTAAKPKTSPQRHSNTQFGNGKSGIISIPPMNDYGLDNAYEPGINGQSDFAEPVGESHHQQQQQHQVENAPQQEYVNYYCIPDYTFLNVVSPAQVYDCCLIAQYPDTVHCRYHLGSLAATERNPTQRHILSCWLIILVKGQNPLHQFT